jgi:hypothetical protein
MVTIYRAAGLRIVIFLDDHEPAHVHIYGDGEAKIDIASERPRLIWTVGMKQNDLQRAMEMVTKNREAFLERWREIHG